MPLARVSTPDQLIVLVPFVLGYHPHDCLVVLGLRGTRLGVVQAARWPHPWGPFDRAEADALVGMIVRDGCDAALLIAYGDPCRRRPALEHLTDALARAGLAVPDRLGVGGDGRWWSVDCTDPRCCPPGGRELPRPSDVPAVAEWVLRGVDPYPDRAAMAASIEPRPDAMPFDFAGLPAVRPTAPMATAAWGAVLRGAASDRADVGTELAWRAAATIAVPEFRDALLQSLCPGLLGPPESAAEDAPGADRVGEAAADGAWPRPGALPRVPYDVLGDGAAVECLLRRLTEFARRLPEPYRADTLAVTAVCAWWYGHGTLAGMCLDRVRTLHPAHRLAGLVEALLASGVRPPAGTHPLPTTQLRRPPVN